jgi:hypothetical protein
MSNYIRRLPLLRKPAQVADPGEMVDLRMEDGSWRQGFRALSAPSTAETGEVLIWVCTEDEYRETPVPPGIVVRLSGCGQGSGVPGQRYTVQRGPHRRDTGA